VDTKPERSDAVLTCLQHLGGVEVPLPKDQQKFQVPKMKGFPEPYVRLFWGWGFHTAENR